MMRPWVDTSTAGAAATAAATTTSDAGSNGSPESPISPSVKKRAHRVSRACDFCHSRSIRCRPSDASSSSCQSCIEYDRKCTYDRPSKKRGVKSSTARMSIPTTTSSSASAVNNSEGSSQANHVTIPTELTQSIITDLVEVYFEIVYPIFPFFHRQTLLHRISRGEHHHDRAFFGALMALCGLTAARMRDGALYSRKCSAQSLDGMPDSRAFFGLAETAIPKDPRASESLDHLKNCSLLAILSIQDSDIRRMKFFLGIYHMLVQLNGMDQEANWPAQTTRIEVEERRRLFWSMYMLEMFAAVCFDSSMVCREAHTTVQYPSEVDDEDLNDDASMALQRRNSPTRAVPYASNRAFESESSEGGTPSWIVGWNFSLDLYRILEHALDRQKTLAMQENQVRARKLFHARESSSATVLDDIMARYSTLPQHFKEIRDVTFNPHEDRYGFEAANIAATIQLVRMTLFSTDEATAVERVQIVREVLHTFSEVPIAYLKAMSTPLLHHLAGIGSFLGRTLQGILLEGEYEQIRAVLLDLAELLSGLGSGSLSGDDPSARLRTQIERTDRLVEEQKQQMMSIHGKHQQLPTLNSMGDSGERPVADQLYGMHADATVCDNTGMPVSFPPDLMDEWSWAFDFAHVARGTP